jgi:hypothetical protein
MPNVNFSYLYRDAGNYKKWATIVFSNPDRLTLKAATEALKAAFLHENLFVAHQIRVPEAFLFSRGNATSDDHCFHEFSAVDASIEDPNDPHSRSISQFIEEVKKQGKNSWLAFDPHDASLQRLSKGTEHGSAFPTT